MDDLDLLPLSERKRMLILPNVSSSTSTASSKGLRLTQIMPDILKEWPGLPRGVKFDPSDEDLLGHLLAEVGKGLVKRHPFISEFIISLDEDHGVSNLHPLFLPGVKQDGSMSYFFHRTIENHSCRHKRQKKSKRSIEFVWHKIGKTRPVFLDGIHHGSKETMALYVIPASGGKPEKTPWLMHQYHVGTNEDEEDLFVSKIFYQMNYNQCVQDFLINSGDGFDIEVVGVPTCQPVVAELHKGQLHVECTSAEASTQDVFLSSLGGCGKIVSKFINYGERNDEMYKAYDTLLLGESTVERAPELKFQNSKVDSICKSQEKLITASFCDTKTAVVHSSASDISREDQETDLKSSDEADIFLDRTLCMENTLENAIDDVNVVGLPANIMKDKSFEEAKPKIVSVQTAVVKTKSNSSEDTKSDIPSEKKSCLNSLAVSSMPIKVKVEPSVEVKNIVLQIKSDQFPTLSKLECSAKSSWPVTLCLSKANIQGNIVSLLYIPTECVPCSGLSSLRPIPDGSHLSTAEIPNTMISGLDKFLSGTVTLVNPYPSKDISCSDGLLSNENQVQGECLDKSSFSEVNFYLGESQLHLVSPSCTINVKPDPMNDSLLTCYHTSCNIEGLMTDNNTERDFLRDAIDHIPLQNRFQMSVSHDNVKIDETASEEVASPGSDFIGSPTANASQFSLRRRMKKSSMILVQEALEEDAPGLLQVLLDRGIPIEEIKLYGGTEDIERLELSSSEDIFEELETVMSKLFSERSSLLRLTSGRSKKASRAVYCLSCLISLIEQARYLQFRQSPVEWGWCRDLQSFIFVFQAHNRIVLERPEYGYATYFYELVASLPTSGQIKRLVTAMKLNNCSRTFLLENKPLLVGEDLTEGDACILESYGWTRNMGLGTMLNYCDRVVHDRRNMMYSSEWRAKIGKLLMSGYDGGRMVLNNIPKKVVEYLGRISSGVKQEHITHVLT
ncbi:hypothetical protein HPP92_011097 [Vanilla planifolia]|uniref:NAC domain-containing protein n=1 Tax=Vanilla planifolia TaxID=51239 RepID=A0A835R184_VANPL|nr:hypothetical protein HPP92_011097 [Vanilla planifolia]